MQQSLNSPANLHTAAGTSVFPNRRDLQDENVNISSLSAMFTPSGGVAANRKII
jgi:hypothetical protein